MSKLSSKNQTKSDSVKTVVLAFGRMNPPTLGHEKLVNKMIEMGDKTHHLELVVSHTQDSKKNPLSPSQKQKHLRLSFPDVKITVASKKEPSIIAHAKRLNDDGFQRLIFVGGSDRAHEFRQLLKKYNGTEYQFTDIQVVSAGQRDPEEEGVTGISASKMREYAQQNNFKEFRKGVPSALSSSQAKDLFDDVRSGMKLNEDVNVLQEGVHDAAIFKVVFLAGGPGCFHGDTEILLCNGTTKKICDVVSGDVLISGDIVVNTFEYDATKPMIEVTFDDGYRVICTEDHEFLINNEWIEAKDLMIQSKRYLSKSEYPNKVYDLCVEPNHQYTLANGQIVHNSGKDFVLKRTLDGHGLVELNSDKALEFLMDKEKLDKRMPESEREQRDVVRTRAKSITELRQRLALEGRNGLIINGTADDPKKIFRIKESLEKMGYTSSMVFVNTSDEVSKERNIARGKHGGRTVPEHIRKEKWQHAQDAKSEFAKSFGESFTEFENSEDLTNPNLDQNIKSKKETELTKIFKTTKLFTERGAEDPVAQDWIKNQLGQQATHAHVQQRFGLKHTDERVDQSAMAQEAARLGLKYYGFGRYGKDGHVTHTVENGHLREIPKVPTVGSMSGSGTASKQPVKQSVKESYLIEETSESEVDIIAKKHHVLPTLIHAQLEMGLNVELEHTTDHEVALQIALDHLYERPDYYTQLSKMKQRPIQKIRETSFGYDETQPPIFGSSQDELSTGAGQITPISFHTLRKRT